LFGDDCQPNRNDHTQFQPPTKERAQERERHQDTSGDDNENDNNDDDDDDDDGGGGDVKRLTSEE
jgi:hypothetical protein